MRGWHKAEIINYFLLRISIRNYAKYCDVKAFETIYSEDLFVHKKQSHQNNVLYVFLRKWDTSLLSLDKIVLSNLAKANAYWSPIFLVVTGFCFPLISLSFLFCHFIDCALHCDNLTVAQNTSRDGELFVRFFWFNIAFNKFSVIITMVSGCNREIGPTLKICWFAVYWLRIFRLGR